LLKDKNPILNKKPTTDQGTGINISEEIFDLKASNNRHPSKQGLGLPEEREELCIFF
jgi:hypothetical protein